MLFFNNYETNVIFVNLKTNIMIFFCICLFLILSILCFALGLNALGFILLMSAVLCGIFFSFAYWGTSKQREIDKNNQEEARTQEMIKFEKEKQKYDSAMSDLVNKYGNPDKVISLNGYDINNDIIAFGNAERIWITGKDLQMSDILNCTYNDNSYIEKGAVSYETRTKNGSMATRAIVGGVLTGGVGAMVGGATAKKNTIVNQEKDTLIHDYTVIINVNSLSEPIIRIPLGNDIDMVDDIVGLMNVIISRR